MVNNLRNIISSIYPQRPNVAEYYYYTSCGSADNSTNSRIAVLNLGGDKIEKYHKVCLFSFLYGHRWKIKLSSLETSYSQRLVSENSASVAWNGVYCAHLKTNCIYPGPTYMWFWTLVANHVLLRFYSSWQVYTVHVLFENTASININGVCCSCFNYVPTIIPRHYVCSFKIRPFRARIVTRCPRA